jgi:hypothetical protein
MQFSVFLKKSLNSDLEKMTALMSEVLLLRTSPNLLILPLLPVCSVSFLCHYLVKSNNYESPFGVVFVFIL